MADVSNSKDAIYQRKYRVQSKQDLLDGIEQKWDKSLADTVKRFIESKEDMPYEIRAKQEKAQKKRKKDPEEVQGI